ncbi:MAG: hypothetical protein ACOCP8_06250 [archaeon]
MEKQEIKIYDDGAEFLDDLYGEKLKTGLNEDQFEDFICYDITSIGSLRIEDKSYNLLSVGSEELYAICQTKTIIGWYKEWETIIEEMNLNEN